MPNSINLLAHDPPIGTGGGGSFFIELPSSYVQIPSSPTDDVNVYGEKFNRYKFANKSYTGIAQVSIIKENTDGTVETRDLPFDASDSAALNLWLTGNTTNVPDLIIQGANDGAILTRKEISSAGSAAPQKQSRQRYYDDGSNDHGVTLTKWQVVDGSNLTVLESDDSADNFFLYVYFHPENV